MVNTNTSVRLSLLFFCLCLSLFGSTLCLAAVNADEDLPLVTITGEGRSLGEVIKDLAQQTGYRVEIDESQLGIKVNGRYVKTDIDSFLRRVLKGNDVFQVIDPTNKVIKIASTQRTATERTLVVEVGGGGTFEERWLDGEPGRTNGDLLEERRRVFAEYDPSKETLDGEPNRTYQDLLDEREATAKEYPVEKQGLDGSEKSMGALLEERDKVMATYKASEQNLDGEPGKTTQDLLTERDKTFSSVNPNQMPLDGEPGKTFQDLLNERDRVFGGDKK